LNFYSCYTLPVKGVIKIKMNAQCVLYIYNSIVVPKLYRTDIKEKFKNQRPLTEINRLNFIQPLIKF